ncbi:MAG: hypothetical protein ACK4KT_02590 [Thermaurantimonas sp.]
MKTWHFKLFGALTGLTGGIIYHYFIGCTGSCAIWSNPYIASGYGSLLGYLAVSMFVDSKRESSKNESSQR